MTFRQNFKEIDWAVKAPPVERKKRAPAKRGAFSLPMISGDYEAYECPVTGKAIEGRAAHRENLKKTGCRLLERGESRDAPKQKEQHFNERMNNILGAD